MLDTLSSKNWIFGEGSGTAQISTSPKITPKISTLSFHFLVDSAWRVYSYSAFALKKSRSNIQISQPQCDRNLENEKFLRNILPERQHFVQFFFFYFVQSWGRSRDWALLQNCCQFKAAQPRSAAPWQRWMLSSLASETLLILISKLNNFLSSNHRVSTNRWARLGTGCWTLPELLRANLAED